MFTQNQSYQELREIFNCYSTTICLHFDEEMRKCYAHRNSLKNFNILNLDIESKIDNEFRTSFNEIKIHKFEKELS